MKMDKNMIWIYKMYVCVCVAYTTNKLLDKKTDELLPDGGAVNAFLIGGGQAGISIAVGLKAAETIAKLL